MKKILFGLMASAVILSFIGCENPNNKKGGKDDSYKIKSPALPASVGENPFAGKKFVDEWEEYFMDFSEKEIHQIENFEGEEHVIELDKYSFDAEKGFLYYKMMKYDRFDDGNLLTWDDYLACVEQFYSVEAYKENYKDYSEEELKIYLDEYKISYDSNASKDDLINLLLEAELNEDKEDFGLPQDASIEEVLKCMMKEDIQQGKAAFETLIKYSYKFDGDKLTFIQQLTDDFDITNPVFFSWFWNFKDQGDKTNPDNLNLCFLDYSFELSLNSYGYYYSINEITANKIKGELLDADDPNAPGTIEIDYTIEGKGSDTKLILSYDGKTNTYAYVGNEEEYFLVK